MTSTAAPTTTRPHPALRLWCWSIMIAAALHGVLTSSSLPEGPPLAPAAALDWWTNTPLERAIGGIARTVVTYVLAYLLLVTVTQLLALAAPGTRLARAVDRLAPRALALATAGVIVASTSTAGASPGPNVTTRDGRPADDVVTMHVLPSITPSAGSPAAEPRTSIPMAPPTAAPTTAAPTAPNSPAPTTTVPSGGADASEPTPAPRSVPSPERPSPERTPGPHRYVVRTGDHLWDIAERVVSLDGTPAAPEVVARYWRALIDLNRDRLVDRTDPDLILPGQELELPPLSGGR